MLVFALRGIASRPVRAEQASQLIILQMSVMQDPGQLAMNCSSAEIRILSVSEIHFMQCEGMPTILLILEAFKESTQFRLVPA